MKLYVWDAFSPDWSDGLAFALADSEEDAKQMIEEFKGRPVDEWGTVKVYDLTEKVCYFVHGSC